MMNTKTMRKAARDLVPGDIMCGQVVLNARTTGSGRIELTLATLGGAADCGVQTHAPDSQFMVELPAGLTPVQAAADKLLDMLRDTHAICMGQGPQRYGRLDIEALLDELTPPKPPTLEEAINVLRNLTQNVRSAGPCATPCSLVADAERLLARVPKA
jgi:hypothetical protein